MMMMLLQESVKKFVTVTPKAVGVSKRGLCTFVEKVPKLSYFFTVRRVL
jgi:hypothetical protein